MAESKVKSVLDQLCAAVSRAFDCVETSVFLEAPQRPQGTEFVAMASTSWNSFDKRRYVLPEDGTGKHLTGWVLANWAPLIVPDIGKLQRYTETLGISYPGLDLKDDPKDLGRAKKLLKLSKDDDLPPLSWMATPVFGGVDWFGGTDLRGAIRCHMPRSGPYFFSEREQQMLEVVATQLGQWWARWRVRKEIEVENTSWSQLVKLLASLNVVAKTALRGSEEAEVFRHTLKEAPKVFAGVASVSIRMLDPEGTALRYGWVLRCTSGGPGLIETGADCGDEPVRKASSDIGVKALLKRAPVESRNGKFGTKTIDSQFLETTAMISAPIGVGDECFGVLDLRWADRQPSKYAKQAAELIGQQLGVYHQLFAFVQNERKAVTEAESRKTLEARAFEDFAHQLRSPIAQAADQIDLGFDELPAAESVRRRWRMVRGLVKRSRRVAASMRLFTEMARGVTPVCRPVSIDRELLLKKLIELADDTQLYAAQRHELFFKVDRFSFSSEMVRKLRVDPDMLEQMLVNLLDNAAKYSTPQSAVRIFGGIGRATGRIYIAIANIGLPFRRGEADLAKQRGWRSHLAKMTGSDGQGIGLWLVDQMMQLHRGKLEIVSPNSAGENEFRLYFPTFAS